MPLNFDVLGDDRILAELGRRFERERLSRDLTQRELADKSGISLRTVKNVEAGNGCSMTTTIALLRGLEQLQRLDQLLPEQPPSPVQLAKLKGRERKRASGKRPKQRNEADRVQNPKWEWKE